MITASQPSSSAAVVAWGRHMKLGVSGAIKGNFLPAAKLVRMNSSQLGYVVALIGVLLAVLLARGLIPWYRALLCHASRASAN